MYKNIQNHFYTKLVIHVIGLLLIALEISAQQTSTLGQYKLAALISSPAIEYAPSISADGQILLFQSNRRGKHEIFIVYKNDKGDWGIPQPIEAVNNYGTSQDLIGGPTLSFDGNRIYFFASFKGRVSVEDIYYSKKIANGWSKPIYASSNINTRDYDGFPSLSSDGKSLYFVRKTSTSSVPKEFCTQIMVSVRQSNGEWGKPTKLPNNINTGCEKYPRILSDNETLIFSRRVPDNDTGFDLYITRKVEDGSWSEPQPITFLNTKVNDIFASVPSSGDIIFFNNNLEGNYDLYAAPLPKAFRPKKVIDVQGIVSDANGQPIEANFDIIRAGKSQNNNSLRSSADDGNFTLVLLEGYDYTILVNAEGYQAVNIPFDLTNVHEYKLLKQNVQLKKLSHEFTFEVRDKTSNIPLAVEIGASGNVQPNIINDSLGYYKLQLEYGDIYNLTITRNGYSTVKKTFALDKTHKDTSHHVIYLVAELPKLKLTVVDAETNEPIRPRLSLLKNNARQRVFNNTITGSYESELEHNMNYQYRLRLNGYFFHQDTIDLKNIYYGRIVTRDIKMIPLKVGNKLTLNNINFDVNSANLSNDSKTILDEVAFLLKQNRRLVIEIGAHSDDVGENDYNMELSDRRAASVMNYLIASGVAARALRAKGHGESMPAVPNDSEENRAKNRRVDFTILSI